MKPVAVKAGECDGVAVSTTSASWLAVLVGIAALAFWAYCLFDFTQADEREIRTFTRPIWVVVLIFGSVLGGLLWLSVGRPQPPADRSRPGAK